MSAARMAIELINNDTDILCEYDLTLLENDTSCDSSWVLEIFTEYVRDDNIWNKMVGGLGELLYHILHYDAVQCQMLQSRS